MRARAIRGWVDATCDSLPESVARTRLRMLGLRVRTQVPVAGIKSIDILVEEAVAIEVDGEQFHRDTFHSDRIKDLEIALDGLHGMRPSASIVFRRWPELVSAVLLALSARDIAASGTRPKLPTAARPRRRPGS